MSNLHRLLDQYRGCVGDENKMIELQHAIEALSLESLSDASVAYRRFPSLMSKLIKSDKQTAKEYILYKLTKKGRSKCHTEKDLCFLNSLERYDLELLCVRAISLLFSEVVESSLVKTSSFLSLLQKSLLFMHEVTLPRRNERYLLGEPYNPKDDLWGGVDLACTLDEDRWKDDSYIMEMRVVSTKMGLTFASFLLEFLIIMDVISLVSDKGKDVAEILDGGKFGFKSKSFVVPKFDVESIPLASKLPMVCVPVGWGRQDNAVDHKGRVPTFAELVGGYLHPGTSDIGLALHLLTTKDASHYYALFNTISSYERLCRTLTQLQSVGFMINREMFEFINNMDSLVDAGLLMPTYLSRVNIYNLRRSLQKFLNDKEYDYYKFTTLWSILDKRVQQARYEKSVLDLASVYEGYTLYFPAFIDFRGRIYRSGIQHFQERDLVRSLICFSQPKELGSFHYDIIVLC